MFVFYQKCKRRRPVSIKFSIKGVKMYDEDETVSLVSSPVKTLYFYIVPWGCFILETFMIQVKAQCSVMSVLVPLVCRHSWWLTLCGGSPCPPPGLPMPSSPSSPTTRATLMLSYIAMSLRPDMPERYEMADPIVLLLQQRKNRPSVN